MFTFTQCVTRVCNRLNKNPNDTAVIARIKNHINDACQEKWHEYPWSFRWRDYPLVLTAQVTDTSSTSTLTATNGSRTVTSTGTPFLATTHVGAWVRFMQDAFQSWYKIISVTSSSQVLIDPAYQGTTGSSKTFQINKTEYGLPIDLSDISRLKLTYNGQPLQMQHQVQVDAFFTPPLSVGAPYLATLLTDDFKSYSYSTGTVTISANTTTLTGSGTSWLANILPGDEMTLGTDTQIYNVREVLTDTSLTLVQQVLNAQSGATYTATRQFQYLMRVQPAPDQPYVCLVKGLRRYFPLVNNSDVNEFLIRCPHAVIESAIWREASSSPDTREDALYAKSEKMWDEAKGQDTDVMPQTNVAPIFDTRFGYR